MTELQQALQKYFSSNNNSMRNLADGLGMSESTVLRWLAGVSVPHPTFEAVVLTRIRQGVTGLR